MQNAYPSQKKQPTLRMADGGMFGAVRSLFSSGPPETITEKYARQDAERAAKMGSPAPAPAPAPARNIVESGSVYNAGSMTAQRMKAAGLRDGGDLRTGLGGNVPGSGVGDKVPAKYEPGEFVVSNAMLDAAPSLRGELHSLRNNVLSSKGVTPEQADAKALGGQGLHAVAGFSFDPLTGSGYRKPEVNPSTGMYTAPTGVPNGQTPGAQAVPTNATNPQAAAPNSGGGSPVRGGGAALPAGEVPRPSLRQGLFGSGSAWGDAASGLKKSTEGAFAYQPAAAAPTNIAPGALRRAANGLGTLAGRASAIGGAALGAYEAAGDAKAGNYGDAALHSADALASAATMTPAAPAALTYLGARGVSSLINNSLSDDAKDTIGGTINQGVRSLGKSLGQDWGTDDSAYLAQKAETRLRSPQPAMPAATPPATQSPAPAVAAQPAATAQTDTPANALRGQTGSAMGNGVSKFTQDGKTLYSNVGTTGDNDALMNRGPVSAQNQRAMDGIQQRQDQGDAALAANAKYNGEVAEARAINGRAPVADTGGFGILDKGYQQARSLRMDAESTMSRQETKAQHAARTSAAAASLQNMQKEATEAPRMAAERNNTLRISQMDNDTRGKIASMQNATTLRGQDITREGHLLTSDVAKANARYQVGKDKRDYETNRSDYANTREDKAFEQNQAADKEFTSKINDMHTTTVDGKPVVDQAGANATRAGVDTALARQVAELKASGTPQDLIRAKNLSDNGVHALAPDMREKLVRSVKLMTKVNAGSSNFNPLKPDPLVSSDPRDYFDMKTHSSGDLITKTGQRIPARFLDKQDSDHWGGTPTNEFNLLRGTR